MALAVGYARGVAHGGKIALAVGNFKGDTLEKEDRMMTYQFFIDDEQFTADGSGGRKIARTEAAILTAYGPPTLISFDHGGMMSNLFWLTDEQMARLRPFFSQKPWQAEG